MSTDVERMERYLRGVAVPEYTSERHQQQLRRRILGEIGNSPTASGRGRTWRIAAAAVILMGLGGAVGVLIETRCHFAGRQSDSLPPFVGRDSRNAYAPSTPDPDANRAADGVPAARDFQEIDLPYSQDPPGDIEVVSVIEPEANSRPDSRTPLYRYVISGQTKIVSRGEPKSAVPARLTSLPPADWIELGQLRQTGKGEDLGTQEQQLKGRVFVFKRERYTLSNGTKITLSVGAPKDAPRPHD